jgi:GAF domain-containing protein
MVESTGNASSEQAVLNPATQAYAELAKIVLSAQPLGAILHRVAELAAQVVEGADDASVTLIEHGRFRTVSFSGPLAVALDERQYDKGFGPCMDAAASGSTIVIEDTAHEDTYRDFAHQALRVGVRHVISVGLPTPLPATDGALNIYGKGSRGPFSIEAREAAASFACYASVALANAALYAGAVEEVAQMKKALASRAVIEQAKGIIMRDKRCDADEAFMVLRNASSRSNRKLRDIAAQIVQSASMK